MNHISPAAGRALLGRSVRAGIVILMLSLGFARGQVSQQKIPPFIFGFSQVAGFGSPVGNPGVWVLTDKELAILKSDFHVNALRFFVHPAFIGLPQLTWVGPESIRYSSYPDSAFVWNRPGGDVDSLDEVIAKLRKYDILPIFWVVTADEYLQYLNKTDLTFLNNPANTYWGQPNPLDYTGIIPKDEVKFLATKIAKHIHDTFGDNFGVNFPEIGALGDACGDRVLSGERAKWNEVIQAIRAVAPNCLITSPELMMSFWHWAAAVDIYWGGNPLCPMSFGQTIPCLSGDAWPRGMPISDYSNLFDMVSVSLYADLHFASDYPCTNHPLSIMADTLLKLLRDQTMPQKWIWAETGWGSPGTEASGLVATLDGLHLDWAANLLTPDNLGGFLLWQAKSLSTNPGGIWEIDGKQVSTYTLVKKFMNVLWDNRTFLNAYHTKYNNDGFTVSEDLFVETDGLVFTRLLGSYLIIYSAGPEQVTFANTGGRPLVSYAFDESLSSPSVVPETGKVTVSGLVPKRVYVFAVPQNSVSISVPAGGSDNRSTFGNSESTQVGYATADVSSGSAPYGTAVFSLTQNGVVVSEAGVPASPPTTSARTFVDYRSGVAAVPGRADAGRISINTGLAVVNRGSTTANVTYTLRNSAGAILTTGRGRLNGGAHVAKFVDQLKDVASDFNIPSDFPTATQFGSLDIAADQPLSILALRLTMNQRNEALLTSTPIADLTKPLGSMPHYFPQFVDGGGYLTTLILLNTSNALETGKLTLFGDSGAPLLVNQVGGTRDSSFPYSIPPGGVFVFETDGSPVDANAGSVQLIPEINTSSPVGAGVFSFSQEGVRVTESGIPSASPTTHARIYIDQSGSHGTGLAIASPGNSGVSVTLKAFQTDGSTPAGAVAGVDLPGNGHMARFVSQLISGLPADFIGVLDLSSPSAFLALTLRSLTNSRGNFLLTTFPIADATQSAPAPIVFPQIADGGGYITEFILLSTGGTASMTLKFCGEDGTPLAIGK